MRKYALYSVIAVLCFQSTLTGLVAATPALPETVQPEVPPPAEPEPTKTSVSIKLKSTISAPPPNIPNDNQPLDKVDSPWEFKPCHWRSNPNAETNAKKFSFYVSGWKACKKHCEEKFPDQVTFPVCVLNKCLCPEKPNWKEMMTNLGNYLPGRKQKLTPAEEPPTEETPPPEEPAPEAVAAKVAEMRFADPEKPDGLWICKDCQWVSFPNNNTKEKTFSSYSEGWNMCKKHCEEEFPDQITVPLWLLNKCTCQEQPNWPEIMQILEAYLPGKKFTESADVPEIKEPEAAAPPNLESDANENAKKRRTRPPGYAYRNDYY